MSSGFSSDAAESNTKAKAKANTNTNTKSSSSNKTKSSSKSKPKASDAKENVARVSSLGTAEYSYNAGGQLLVTIPVEALPPAVPDAVSPPPKGTY